MNNSPRVTWLAPQPQAYNSPRFDPHQFNDAARSLGKATTDITYSDLRNGMHVHRVPDLTRGRRLPVPAWATNDELLRNVIVKVLENRFYVRNQQGTLQERLDRCRAAAKRLAASKRAHLDASIQQFRALVEQRFADLDVRSYEQLFCGALGGKGASARLKMLEKQVSGLDGEVFVSERPELIAAVLYQYFRLGYNSCAVAESLGLKPPCIRQIVFRARKVAQREGPAKRRKRRSEWLTLQKAEEIRRLSRSVPWDEIAFSFGIVRETVRRIATGETWRRRG